MTKYEQIWSSLQDEEYRREFADDQATGLAFQIRMLRERNGWTQEELAQRIGKRQETISLWENPNYGNYTFKTLKSLARAFDVVPVFRLGAFSEFVEWNANLTRDRLTPPNFAEENATGRVYAPTTQFVVATAGTVALAAAVTTANVVAGGMLPSVASFIPAWERAFGTAIPLPEEASPVAVPATEALSKKEPPRALAA